VGFRFSVVGSRLWVLGFHGDCGWVWLLIITGVILIFGSILFVSVVGCGFSVLGSWFWVVGCGVSVLGSGFS